MKIAILTQYSAGSKIKKLYNAAIKLGHECQIIDIKETVIEVGTDNPENNGIYAQGKSLLEFDLVMLYNVFSYRKRVISIISYLRNKGVRVFDNNLQKVGYNIDKVYDSILFSLNNISYPKTFSVVDEDDFRDNCSELGFPVIVKHVGTGKGVGVYKLEDIGEVDDFIDDLKEKDKQLKNYLIQEYVPYEKDLRILLIGKKIMGAMQRIPKEGEFRANFSRGGSVKLIEIDKEIEDLAKKVAELAQTINAGVDVIITPEGKKYILEVNRTPGFEGFELASEKDIAKSMIEAALEFAY